jgi:hypothetical protein
MHLDQLLAYGKANAKTPFRSIERSWPLYEKIEQPRQQVGINAHTGVAYLDNRAAILDTRIDENVAPTRESPTKSAWE